MPKWRNFAKSGHTDCLAYSFTPNCTLSLYPSLSLSQALYLTFRHSLVFLEGGTIVVVEETFSNNESLILDTFNNLLIVTDRQAKFIFTLGSSRRWQTKANLLWDPVLAME